MVLIKITARYVQINASGYYFSPRRWVAKYVSAEALGTDPVKAAKRATDLYKFAEQAREEYERNGGGGAAKHGTIKWVIKQYEQDDDYLRLKPKTKLDYDKCLNAIIERVGDRRPEAVTVKVIKNWYRGMYRKTPWWANAVLRILRLVFAQAIAEGLIATNPARQVKMRSNAPRQQVPTDDQIEAFVAAAFKKGLPSLALATRLAADTGQRQGDILTMPRSALVDGEIRLVQSKRGAEVVVPLLKTLAASIEHTTVTGLLFVIYEKTGRPYVADTFRHEFRDVANDAGWPEDLQFRDIRRYAVLQLARAGCTESEIAAITGHSETTVRELLRTYLPRDSVVATNAIVKLETYRNKAKADG